MKNKNHRGAVMTLIGRKSKTVTVLNTHHKKDKAIFKKIDKLLSDTSKRFFKSITPDNCKEFSNIERYR